MNQFDLIVTRHEVSLKWLASQGVDVEETPVVAQVTPEEIRGKNVVGTLPPFLAVQCRSFTPIEMRWGRDPRPKHGTEFTMEIMERYAHLGTPLVNRHWYALEQIENILSHCGGGRHPATAYNLLVAWAENERSQLGLDPDATATRP